MKITKWMRFILITLSVVMAFSLFACGDPEETTTAQKEETTDDKTDATTESKGTEATDSETTEPNQVTTEGDSSGDNATTEGDTDTDTDTETTESGSETGTESGTETDTGSDTETDTDTTETTEAICEHVPVEDAAVEPTCTETGLTKGSHCELCGEILVPQEVIPTRAHNPKNVWEYAANPDGDTAIIVNPCADCGAAAETKAATFMYGIEAIYGDLADDNVTIFAASETVDPIMGANAMLEYAPGHLNYPADGYKPIRDTAPFATMFGFSGWAFYLGSSTADNAAFQIVDAEGNVLVEWTAIPGIPDALPTISIERPDVTALMGPVYTDGAANAYSFNHIISVAPYINILGGKTVKVVFAFTTVNGVDGDVYIPYANLEVVVPACAHSAATETEAKAPTCTEAGNEAYKTCPTCGKFVLADGTLADEAPVLPAKHTWDEGVVTTPPTCTEKGEKLFTCTVDGCDGTETVEVDIDPTNHPGETKVVNHKVSCAACEAPITEGVPNFVIDANALSGVTEYTQGLGLTYALSADGQYVTYTQPANNEAPGGGLYAYITFPKGNINVPESATGKYIMLKYRTTYDDRIEIFAGANNGSQEAKGSVDNFSITQKADNTGSLIADGQWHYVIMSIPEIFAGFNSNAFAPEDGTTDTYILDYLRLDFFNNASGDTAKTFDLAYVAYAESVEQMVEYAGMDSYTYVYGYSGGVIYETVTVGAADVVVPNYVVDANALSGLTDHKGLTYALDASGEFVTYTQKTDGSDDCSFYVTFPDAGVNVPSAPTGKYVLIKYRTTYTGKWDMFVGANWGHTQAVGGSDSFGLNVNNGSNNGAIIADGTWQYLILDLKFVEGWGGVKPEDGTTDTYQIDYFRIDPFNAASDVANTVDIAYVAYADSVDKLVDYAGMASYTFGDSYSGGVVGQTVVVGE